MNLAQFPEDRNEQNCHQEQQELGHQFNLFRVWQKQQEPIVRSLTVYPQGLQLNSSASSIHGDVGET